MSRGCIDPHGMWPFPASREVCPKCIAIRNEHPAERRHREMRESVKRRGLPYGWWKEPETWAAIASVFLLVVMLTLALAAWFNVI